jgi:hypothetical protein
MEISIEKDDRFHIRCDRDEVIILANAINNLGQAVDHHDHHTLIGASEAEVRAVHDRLLAALRVA